VAVIYAKNAIPSPDLQVTYVPIAVGRILTSKMPEELKGKAVQVEHFLYDELWNSGPKKIPDEIRMIAKGAAGDEDDEEDEEEEKKEEEVKESPDP
jgi:ribosomal protein L31E